jgi:hypothetical protein
VAEVVGCSSSSVRSMTVVGPASSSSSTRARASGDASHTCFNKVWSRDRVVWSMAYFSSEEDMLGCGELRLWLGGL